MIRHNRSQPPDGVQADSPMEQPSWRAWMQDLGRRQRRLREFVGLSQEQLAHRAGVSQGAISRLEAAKGLATPLLIVVKVNSVLASELRRLDPTLLSPELREAVELHRALTASGGALGLGELQLADDPRLEELVHLYRETPERHRPGALSVLRAMVAGLRKGAPVVLLCALAV